MRKEIGTCNECKHRDKDCLIYDETRTKEYFPSSFGCTYWEELEDKETEEEIYYEWIYKIKNDKNNIFTTICKILISDNNIEWAKKTGKAFNKDGELIHE